MQYLQAVLQKQRFYTVKLDRDDGADIDERIFQVLDIFTPQHRPKHISNSIVKRESFSKHAYCVTLHDYDVWDRDEATIKILPVGAATCVDILDIASLRDMRHNLSTWDCVAASQEIDCLQLVDSKPAVPTIPLTDESCPLLCILKELREQGWVPLSCTVNHSAGQHFQVSVWNTRLSFFKSAIRINR